LEGEELNILINNFCNYRNGAEFDAKLLNEELLNNLNVIIEKYEKNHLKDEVLLEN
jgi:hypothetical protein